MIARAALVAVGAAVSVSAITGFASSAATTGDCGRVASFEVADLSGGGCGFARRLALKWVRACSARSSCRVMGASCRSDAVRPQIDCLYDRGAVVITWPWLAGPLIRAPTLERPATIAAGKRVRVYCDRRSRHWSLVSQIFGVTNTPLSYLGGLAAVGRAEMVLAPRICFTLFRARPHLHESTRVVADGLLALGHEAMHLRGIANERAADCGALRVLPKLATYFGYRPHSEALRQLIQAAAKAHRYAPPPYPGPCP